MYGRLATGRRSVWRRARHKNACGRCRSRGRTDRAHRSLENVQNTFPTSVHRPSSINFENGRKTGVRLVGENVCPETGSDAGGFGG